MKILVLSPQDIFPPNDGGRRRTYDVVKQLSRRHEVVLVCPRLTHPSAMDLSIRVHDINGPGRRRQILSPRFAWRLRRLLRREAPDVILMEFPWHGFHAAIARFPRRIPIILDAHNAEGERSKGLGSRWWRLIALYERFVLKLVDQVFVVSEYDLRGLQRAGLASSKAQWVPNGFDASRFHPNPEAGKVVRSSLNLRRGEVLLLFFGHLAYQPNIEALELLHQHVLPLLDEDGLRYRLVVAGKGSAEDLRRRYPHPRAVYLGEFDPIQDLINAADVVVAPMIRGGNTRVRFMETIACGKPLVSTQAAAEGMDRTVCGDLLLVADDWPGFASDILKCLRNPASIAVPPLFTAKYEWEAIIQRIRFDGD